MNGNGQVRSPLSLNPYYEVWSLSEAVIEIHAPHRSEGNEIERERFENGNVVDRPSIPKSAGCGG